MSTVQKIQKNLGDLPALLMTDAVSIRYTCGFHIDDGAAVITPTHAWVITDSRYIEAAAASITDMEVLCTDKNRDLDAILRDIFSQNHLTSAGASSSYISYKHWHHLEKVTGAALRECDLIKTLRAGKEQEEVDNIVKAQRIAEKALEEVLNILRPGLTEKEVAAELVYRMYRYGGEGNSFDPIVVTGAKSSMPHGVPGDEVIKEGDFVTMDFGTLYHGYCSDMTRTVAVGSATEEMKKIYQTVLDAQKAGIDAAAKPGTTGKQIHDAAAAVIAQAGYGPYFNHGFGHSLGLEIHEEPRANTLNDKPLPEGTVISAEPGIYLPGKFGVRIEDMLWLHNGTATDLTNATRDLLIL